MQTAQLSYMLVSSLLSAVFKSLFEPYTIFIYLDYTTPTGTKCRFFITSTINSMRRLPIFCMNPNNLKFKTLDYKIRANVFIIFRDLYMSTCLCLSIPYLKFLHIFKNELFSIKFPNTRASLARCLTFVSNCIVCSLCIVCLPLASCGDKLARSSTSEVAVNKSVSQCLLSTVCTL